jgi:hypothetical protein
MLERFKSICLERVEIGWPLDAAPNLAAVNPFEIGLSSAQN